MPETEDLKLVELLIQKQKSAWVEFLNRYQGLVYARIERTALRCQTKINRAEMEDICAEVFAGLLANEFSTLRSFEGKSSLATWLCVIAHRVSLRQLTKIHIRKTKSLSADSSSDGSAIFEPQDNLDALSELIHAEDQQRLRETLALLSESDQQILKMYFHDDLGYAEIGKRIGVSINTVGPKLHRAQQRLKKLMRWV